MGVFWNIASEDFFWLVYLRIYIESHYLISHSVEKKYFVKTEYSVISRKFARKKKIQISSVHSVEHTMEIAEVFCHEIFSQKFRQINFRTKTLS